MELDFKSLHKRSLNQLIVTNHAFFYIRLMRVGLKLQLIHCYFCNLAAYHMFAYILHTQREFLIRYIDVNVDIICRTSDPFDVHFLRMKKPSIYQAETIVNFVGRMCIERSHGSRILDVIARRTISISTINRICN